MTRPITLLHCLQSKRLSPFDMVYLFVHTYILQSQPEYLLALCLLTLVLSSQDKELTVHAPKRPNDCMFRLPINCCYPRRNYRSEFMLSTFSKLDYNTGHADNLILVLTLPSSHSDMIQSAAGKYTNFHRLLISLLNTTFSAIRYHKAPAGSSCLLFLFFFRCEEVDIYRLYKQERRLV